MLQHRKKLEDEYGQKILDAREAQERQKILEFERRSGGRKKPEQVLFTNNQECPFCNVPVKYVLDCWNMNKMISGFSDLSIPYNADYQDDQLTFKFNPDIIRSPKMLALKRNTTATALLVAVVLLLKENKEL